MTDISDAMRPHALIVGASSGIGAALSTRLAVDHHVSLLARRADRLEPLAGGHGTAYACDVADGASLTETIKAAVAANGKIDRFVYCAGRQLIKPLRAVTADDMAEVVNVNLIGALVSAAAFASSRNAHQESVFCVISSIAAQRPEPGILAYSAAKAGLDALVHGLARECAPKRAVAIAPGWLDTEMTQAQPHVYNEEFRAKLAASTPRGIATVEEVVDLAMFVMSDAARSITGQTITIDAGASL
jgi:NAD(P)-dependent dehydrogenase (short-subunit alcohol dehydrogenase family)